MKKVYAVAHTHWDFEWYFTRQEARVQFIFHMDDVFKSLKKNELDYYMLDGQMSIVDDYLATCPEKRTLLEKYVKAGRLFVGPWYTQIDEMITSGESIVKNIRIGSKLSNQLGQTTKVGYLPDSFGQGQDMPKIYNGFGINSAVFWRGMPTDLDTRYFYWSSNDGSKVLTANIKNGYYAGVDLIENDNFEELMQKISTSTDVQDLVLPIGGDQRAVDFNLKERIELANKVLGTDYQVLESNYPEYFKALEKSTDLQEFSGEFIDPSDSKIHRGIYSSRYDLKQMYDLLERRMTYQVEPLAAIAKKNGIENKQGLIDGIWKIIARGQAHDSSGGSNSDKTNANIYQRAVEADQLSQSLKDYLLRKLSISIDKAENLILWNPLPIDRYAVQEIIVTTKMPNFTISNQGKEVNFDILEQNIENAATLRRDRSEMNDDFYYVSKIALKIAIPATDWVDLNVTDSTNKMNRLIPQSSIKNQYYEVFFKEGQLNLIERKKNVLYKDFISIEDGGDEGDTYDYSPAFEDWIMNLNFADADVKCNAGNYVQTMFLKGVWSLPSNLEERAQRIKSGYVKYELKLQLNTNSKVLRFKMKVNNQVLDHRMRLILNTEINAKTSFADTPFGTIERPVIDPKMDSWKEIGYHEEPTALRPMIHYANIHNQEASCSFITFGMKAFQVIGRRFNQMAITLFRGVGYLGRPDLKRRPGDASGLTMKMVATPDSQLQGKLDFEGGIVIGSEWDPRELQSQYLELTQNNLFYQKQTMNRFTTPLQYFMMNPLEKAVKHNPILKLKNLKVTLSNFGVTEDQAGFELRIYNPTDYKIDNPGDLELLARSNVHLLDLNGKSKHTVANALMSYKMTSIKPGEIRTYGIFPIR